MSRITWLARLGFPAIFAIATACGGSDVIVNVGGTPDTLQIVSLDLAAGTAVLSQLNLTVGESVELSAVALNSLGHPVGTTISWSSTLPDVASVDDQGLVVALAPGSTTITASTTSITASLPTVVEDPTGPQVGELNWWCDWRYQIGTSDNAVRGTPAGRGILGLNPCHGGRTAALPAGLETVAKINSACTTNWPAQMVNIMRANTAASADAALVVANGVVSPLSVGQYFFHRIYFCATVPPGQSLNSHFIHFGQGSISGLGEACEGGNGCYSGRWFWDGGSVQADSTFTMQFAPMFNMTGVGRGQGGFKWGGDNAAEFHTHFLYMLEMRVHKFHADSARFDVRVSDHNGNVLSDSRDFLCTIGSCQEAGGYNSDYAGEHAVYISDWLRLVGYEIGKNTTVGGTPSTSYLEFGGSAIRVSTDPNAWIGLYPVGPEGPIEAAPPN